MLLSWVWAYEKPEPNPEPACTNNDEKPCDTPSPDIQHFSNSAIEFERNKTVENNENDEKDTSEDGPPMSQSVYHEYEAADTRPEDPSPES